MGTQGFSLSQSTSTSMSVEGTAPISGPDFFLHAPPEGSSGWRPHLESLQVGALVHVTDDAHVLERECHMLLSWPNDDKDLPRTTTQVGKAGTVLEIDVRRKLVLLDRGVGCLPIAALKEFERPAPPWLSHLEQHGYVILKKIATPDEVDTARQMIWDTFEERFSVHRDKVSTWTELGGSTGPGIFTKWGLPQSQGPWFIRGLRRSKEVFSQVWGTDDLITSMDAIMVWKPWWAHPDTKRRNSKANPWLPRTEGLHLDQNPYRKPELDCVQGMMPLYDVTEMVGGLEVVPGSHCAEAKDELKNFYGSDPWLGDDFCAFQEPGSKAPNVPLNTPGRLLVAEAGDLILWDSRTVHGGVVGKGQPPDVEHSVNPCLARLTVNFCMTPMAKVATLEELEFRKTSFLEGRCLNHCPHKPNRDMHAGQPAPEWQPTFDLDDHQKTLLPWNPPVTLATSE